MAAIARNNAFGAGAPSWNLSFPAGELTAAEITAYCPHWLKSIDVVNRFLCHGARTVHIAALLNEFRNFPDNRIFSTNSTLVMMSYAMRKAGFDGWCVMTHFKYSRENFLPESGLSVTNFRTPCTTQPRDVTSEDSHHAVNQEVRPVPFKDLAKHVKKHPSGDDALDLARCVQYAVKHPDEVWLFPTDFQSLTAHLGGPTTITPAHLDEEVFARRDDVKIPTTKRKRSTAIKPISKNKQPVSQQQTNKQLTGAHSFINILSKPGPSQPRKRGNDHLAANDTNSAEECEAVHEENELFGQLAKKRKLSRGRSLFNSYIDDDEFLPDENEASEDIPKKGFGGPEQSELPHNEVNGSVALHKARDGKRAAVEPETVAPQLDLGHNYQYTQPYTEPYVQPYATTANPLPVLLTPPILPANRLQITSQNIHHYALPPFASQSDMWTTAFHYKRFGGARQSAPYRELHTLCCLDENDTGDWAENIRFATEQWLYYGTIWTEFEGHLKKIRKARLEWGWKSPEAIRADAKKGSRAA
ncbi:hypothetical protein COCSADRAFT_94418 [Bipolaris sorokiniana ND90Pr]|uniref:Uncharacterized protein n=1 Tax=Cochliobolus sativus (strain ND90Pr / ATCC 201652) TaxID=665912 RepID=M2SZK2_COCSN|nr:uncharacterized protein COCSADRAFT_94418 [Bipolaris sorokiniana ND90Pr]EMD62376.1 hypothetical protein COCSADRAFT_94418 [Bipolaris sorokiniana ND90Pr]